MAVTRALNNAKGEMHAKTYANSERRMAGESLVQHTAESLEWIGPIKPGGTVFNNLPLHFFDAISIHYAIGDSTRESYLDLFLPCIL